MSPRTSLAAGAALLILAAGTPALAQLGPLQTPGLPGLPTPTGGRLPIVGDAANLARRTIDATLRAPARLTGLARRSDGALQTDPDGWPVVTAEVVAIGLSDVARSDALLAGFTLVREERLEALDLSVVVLAPPPRVALARAVARLQSMDPTADVSFNHIHSLAGAGPMLPAHSPSTPSGPLPAGGRLGLIDTGVEATHPALAGSRISQRGFAGPPRLGAHGTAVASLMIGRSGVFSGAAPGAALLVADIYGGQATGGASTGLAQALAWMVEQDVQVVNISLVGPRNPLVEQAVARAQARGMTIVAAAGNDGPAAPPLYPAAYEGVIGVSAVNGRNRILPEAGRGPQVDFTAPGADMAAAGQAGTWTGVRGSSFAAPLVAGLLARSGGGSAAVEALSQSATDLGSPGRDPVFGHGLVGADLRLAPAAVGARGLLGR